MVSLFGMGSMQPFDGESDTEEFLRQFSLQAAIFDWNDDRKAAIIQHYLVDKAKSIYDALDETKKKSIVEISKALRAGCVQSQESLMSSFYNRKPLPNENLFQYGQAIQKLLMKAMPGIIDPCKTLLLRTQLIQHVPQNIQILIRFNIKQTWDELLVSLADLVPDSKSFGTIGSAYLGYKQQQEPLDVNYAMTELVDRSGRAFNGACFYCKNLGHKVSNCFRRQNDEARSCNKSNQAFFSRGKGTTAFSKPKETSAKNIVLDETDFVESNVAEFGKRDVSHVLESAELPVLEASPVVCGVPLLSNSVVVSCEGQRDRMTTNDLFDDIPATNATPEAKENIQPKLYVEMDGTQAATHVSLMITSTEDVIVECGQQVRNVNDKNNELTEVSFPVSIDSDMKTFQWSAMGCATGAQKVVPSETVLPFWLYENEVGSWIDKNALDIWTVGDGTDGLYVGKDGNKVVCGNDIGGKRRNGRVSCGIGIENGGNRWDVDNLDNGNGWAGGGEWRKGIGVENWVTCRDNNGGVDYQQTTII